MSSLKKVASNSLLYTASSILLRASSIIFFPIFSLYLTKADYGVLSITQTIGTFATVFAGLELTRSLTRFIFNAVSENKVYNSGHLIYTTLITSILFSIIIIGILSFSGSYLLKSILKDIPFYPFVFFFLLSIPFSLIINTCKTYLKATHQGMKVFILDMSFSGFSIFLNLLFVSFFKMNVMGIIAGTLVSSVIFSIILFFSFYRKFNFGFDKNIFFAATKYAFPLLPYLITGMVLESVDKFFLNSKFGSELSGIYYIAITFAYIFSAGKEAVINAFTPWMFKSINTEKEATISRTITYIFFVAGIFAVAISWFSKEALTILSSNTDFIIAYRYIPFTVLGMYIIFLGQLYNIKTYFFSKYMKYLTATTLLGIVVDVIACYFLVEKMGIYGAVISIILAYSAHVVGIIILSIYEQEKRKIYNEKKLFLILTGITVIIMFPLLDNETIYFLLAKTLAYLCLIIITIFVVNKHFRFIEKLKQKFFI